QHPAPQLVFFSFPGKKGAHFFYRLRSKPARTNPSVVTPPDTNCSSSLSKKEGNPLFHLSQGNTYTTSLLFQPKRNTSKHKSKDLKPIYQAQDTQ
ncbi:hypothetical protein Taro_004489, partial [Colocasia esculenta]|nr:hypothetical protein [Colocasia esculenta]